MLFAYGCGRFDSRPYGCVRFLYQPVGVKATGTQAFHRSFSSSAEHRRFRKRNRKTSNDDPFLLRCMTPHPSGCFPTGKTPRDAARLVHLSPAGEGLVSLRTDAPLFLSIRRAVEAVILDALFIEGADDDQFHRGAAALRVRRLNADRGAVSAGFFDLQRLKVIAAVGEVIDRRPIYCISPSSPSA